MKVGLVSSFKMTGVGLGPSSFDSLLGTGRISSFEVARAGLDSFSCFGGVTGAGRTPLSVEEAGMGWRPSSLGGPASAGSFLEMGVLGLDSSPSFGGIAGGYFVSSFLRVAGVDSSGMAALTVEGGGAREAGAGTGVSTTTG